MKMLKSWVRRGAILSVMLAIGGGTAFAEPAPVVEFAFASAQTAPEDDTDIEPVDTVQLILQAEPTKGGSVWGTGRYVADDTVSLSSAAATDYHFICWLHGKDTVSRTKDFRLPITAEMAAQDTIIYTALFEHDPLAVTIRTHLTAAEHLTMPELYACLLEAGSRVNDENDRMAEMQVWVNGERLPATFDTLRNVVRAWYTPKAFGETMDVRFEATSKNGLSASLQRQLKVEKADTAAPNRTVRTMEKVLINFPDPGQTNGGVYNLPQFVGHYESIMAHLYVKCPAIQGACDDWDRVAWIEAQGTDGQWHEIIRYITSYGKACNHHIDVTEFASYLQGEVPLRMYIETWGTGGWDITLDFEYISGVPQFLYTELVPLWDGVFPFGDPARLQPLDTLSAAVPSDVAAMSLRIVTTGHGWGSNNTANAAEFYNATHKVLVDDTAISQNLWTKCNPNPDSCQPQAGTWRYNRAGWCPGAISPGFHYNLTGRKKQPKIKLAYIFDERYVDLCHPHNPACVSGKTCTDCNDGYNPMYYISSYLVYWYNQMYEGEFLPEKPTNPTNPTAAELRQNDRHLELSTWPNPTTNEFSLRCSQRFGAGLLQVIDAQGKVYKQQRFSSSEELMQQKISLSGMPAGSYVIRLHASDWFTGSAVVIKQ